MKVWIELLRQSAHFEPLNQLTMRVERMGLGAALRTAPGYYDAVFKAARYQSERLTARTAPPRSLHSTRARRRDHPGRGRAR